MGTTRGSRVVFGGRPKTSLNPYFPVPFGEDHGGPPNTAGQRPALPNCGVRVN